MTDLYQGKIPTYTDAQLSGKVKRRIRKHSEYKAEINRALQRYYNKDWGDVPQSLIIANNHSIECKHGMIEGVY